MKLKGFKKNIKKYLDILYLATSLGVTFTRFAPLDPPPPDPPPSEQFGNQMLINNL